MLCKDSKQHHVMFHELYSISSLLRIDRNVRLEIPYKVLYFETPFLMIFKYYAWASYGLIVTMVGYFGGPPSEPEDDWCVSCRETRLATEKNLKTCRIVGPVVLSIDAVLLFVSYFLLPHQEERHSWRSCSGTNFCPYGISNPGSHRNWISLLSKSLGILCL